jgi:hypothetical protein
VKVKVQAKRVKLGFAGKVPGLVLVEDRRVRGLERAGDRRRLVKVGRELVQDQEPQDPA